MKVSIVTPVLNRVETLNDTLQSVSSQTYSNIEHIVQDGGSTDGSAQLARNWVGQHEVYLQSTSDQGLYDALNKGIARCNGDIVGLLGSDDFLSDSQVVSNVAMAFSDGSIDGVYGDLDLIYASGRVMRHWRAGSFQRDRMRWGWMPPHPTLYLRRTVFERFGAYDAGFRIAGDYDAILRWVWTGKIRLAYVPRVLVKMRQGGVSTGSVSGLLTKTLEDYRALRRNHVGGAATLAAKNLRKLGQFSALIRSLGH